MRMHYLWQWSPCLQEMAASGVRATELLKRVRVHGSGLPAHVKEPLNQAMLSAINRRALLFSTEDIDGSSSDTIQEQSRLLPGHESDQQQQEEELMADQHGDSISDVTMQRLTVDEQDGEALRLALLAAGHPSSAMALMHRSATQGLSKLLRMLPSCVSVAWHPHPAQHTCTTGLTGGYCAVPRDQRWVSL
jgi:hypothetical protein